MDTSLLIIYKRISNGVKNVVSFLKWLVALAIVLGAAFLIYGSVKITQPYKTEGEPQVFVVPSGATTKEVAGSLEEEGLISSAFFFQLHVKLKKTGEKIQAGNYELSPTLSIGEIAARLTAGEVVDDAVRFTILEGWRAADIASALQEAGIANEREYLKFVNPAVPGSGHDFSAEFSFLADKPQEAGLEGYLFPDTYLIGNGSSPEEITRKFLQNFNRKLSSDLRQAISDQKRTIYEIVTLASIIEREVGRNLKKGTKLSAEQTSKLEEERKLVASVFYNRLAIGMALESDATVAYITGSSSNRATLEETKINSPYNTYRYRGLPPGPISNPSLSSLEAAIYPADSDHLFFLTSADGTAYFGRTLDEHIQNRERYLE